MITACSLPLFVLAVLVLCLRISNADIVALLFVPAVLGVLAAVLTYRFVGRLGEPDGVTGSGDGGIGERPGCQQ